MLTQLSTVKARLGLSDVDPQYDVLLTSTINAVSARFDRECNRTLARTEHATQEFPADETEIVPACYPIESVAKFEIKFSEAEGWQDVQPAPDYLIRQGCVVSLSAPLCTLHSSLARITYAGGYLLPGDNVQPATFNSQLPPDLEQAAVEQVAY